MKFHSTPGRIYSIDDRGELVAEITFPTADGRTYCITRTFVDDSLHGQGVASQLVRAAVKQIHAQGGAVTATCSYASKWLEKHPDAQ